jgi:hypothetical protein
LENIFSYIEEVENTSICDVKGKYRSLHIFIFQSSIVCCWGFKGGKKVGNVAKHKQKGPARYFLCI